MTVEETSKHCRQIIGDISELDNPKEMVDTLIRTFSSDELGDFILFLMRGWGEAQEENKKLEERIDKLLEMVL